MTKRILTALVGIPFLIYAIQFAPPLVAILLIFAAMILALTEYFLLLQEPPGLAFRVAGYAIGSMFLLAFYADLPVVSHLLASATGILLIIALFGSRDPGRGFSNSAFTLFGAAYVGGLMAYLVAIRMIDRGGETGSDLLMMLFVMIWAADIFAFLFGKSIGRRKLAPVISPKKTVEGAVAAFVFSILAGVICRYFFVQQVSILHAAALGAVVGILGQIGDLCESILKRAVHVKDSGTILPGHGGMLDRIDSLLFGAPAMYYYFYLFLRP